MSRIAPVSPDLVWFSGPDTVRFLNDLVSQEIGDMAAGGVRRSLLLGPRGKLDHLMWVLRGEETVGLVTDPARGEDLASTLLRYRIRVKVDVDVEKRPLWVVMPQGRTPGWDGDASGQLNADLSWRSTARTLIAGDRPDYPNMSHDLYEQARIEDGEPLWGVDVDEKTIPQETESLDLTVDFDKGCFLGQELVGRIHSRGHVNRHLRILELSGPSQVADPIRWEDSEVGTMTSKGGDFGMGLIRREVSPGDRVLVGNYEATVRAVG